MAFWSDATQSDPKRQYRFIADIGGEVNTFTVKKVEKPSFSVSETEHKYLNHTYYYPGRVTWNTISVTLVDQGGADDTAQVIANIVSASGYNPQDAESSDATISKKSAVNSLEYVIIEQLDSVGNTVEKWTLKNAWIQDVKFGNLDYEGDDLTEIELVLRYDWAELEAGRPRDRIWKAGS